MLHKVILSRIKSSFSADWSLDEQEVQARRQQFGSNDFTHFSVSVWREVLINTIKDPMIWFLVGTAILFAGLKNYYEATILALAIIPLTGMDFFLHWRTEATTEGLGQQLATSAVVVREGKKRSVAVWELVPGDLILVVAGGFFPADGLIVGGSTIQVEESALSGESLPVTKQIVASQPLNREAVVVSDKSWAFAGTRLLTGEAMVRVVYTGKETLYGQIIQSVLQTGKVRTPLQALIANLVFKLIIAASLLCVFLALVRYAQGFGLIDTILSAATLAVAALPDEFPVVFTFFLSVGVYRMARNKALVRRAVSVENLGRVTCICSDKTGTITEGRLQLSSFYPVSGVEKEALLSLLALASRADSFDLLDLAILDAAAKATQLPQKVLHSFPFTEDRKRETAVVEQSNHWLVVTKGAPETILALCDLSPDETRIWLERIAELAAQTYKVLACASITVQSANQFEEPTGAYQFKGLVAFIDPVREGVAEAIQSCRDQGIHVLMITGDHPATAAAIARQIGLGDGQPKVVLAHDLGPYLTQTAGYNLNQIDVIARAIPMQKYDVVKALQANDQIVAVTGDGVNDVPALKIANIGIAMGERGTQSAREVADIILLDDNFDSIAKAINEGKLLFQNLRLCFKYLLMIHFPFVISAALIPLFGFPLLYFPIQIVLIELIIHPTALLVFQDLPDDGTRRLYKGSGIFSRYDVMRIVMTGLVTTLLLCGCFVKTLPQGIMHARTLVLAILAFMSIAITIGLAGFKTRTTRLTIFFILIMLLTLIQIPFFAAILDFTPLSLREWGFVLLAAIITWFTVR